MYLWCFPSLPLFLIWIIIKTLITIYWNTISCTHGHNFDSPMNHEPWYINTDTRSLWIVSHMIIYHHWIEEKQIRKSILQSKILINDTQSMWMWLLQFFASHLLLHQMIWMNDMKRKCENKRQTTLVIKKYIFVALVTHLIQWKFTNEIKNKKLQHSAFSKWVKNKQKV